MKFLIYSAFRLFVVIKKGKGCHLATFSFLYINLREVTRYQNQLQSLLLLEMLGMIMLNLPQLLDLLI